MRYETKRLKSSIRLALMTAIAALPMTAFAAADEPEVYDLEEVEVVGVHETAASGESEQPSVYAGGQIARTSHLGVLGERDFMDVPFNVTTFNKDMIENKQATSVVDIITNDASVSDQTLSGASQAWYIRGFKSQQQDVQFNGLYGVAPRFYAGVEGLERVELLKGPGALLGGMAPNGSVGGVINFIPKRAEGNKTSVTLAYGNKHQFSQHIDTSFRSEDGKYGVRVNLYNNRGETAAKDERMQTSTQTLAFDYRGTRDRLSLDLGLIYNEIKDPQYRITFNNNFIDKAGGMPRVDINSKFGSPGTFRRISEKYGVFRTEHDFNKNWMGYAAFGMRSTAMDYLYNEFRMNNASGAASRRYRYNNQVNKANSLELGVKGTVMTGALKHELTLAANRMHYTRYMYNRMLGGYTPAGTIYAPVWGTPTGDLTWRIPKNDETTLSSVALTDVMTTADERWIFIVGGRLQSIDVTNYRDGSGNTRYSHMKRNLLSPAFAIVHKLNKTASLYANYIQGLSQDEAPSSAANGGTLLPPYKAKQYEVGAKFDFGKMAATVSAFTLTSPGVITNAANVAVVDGEVRNRGLEVNFFGEPKKGTRLTGGMTWLDAKYQKTQNDTYDGHRKEGAPHFTAVLGVERDIHGVQGLALSANMTYNSMTYINQLNNFRISPWVRFDVGARYSFHAGKTPVTVRANVYNVFNRNYWRGLEKAIYLGAGRTYMLSVTADF